MEQMAKELAERARIPEDNAENPVEVLMEILKERLPDALYEQIEKALSGELDIRDLAKRFSSLLGS